MLYLYRYMTTFGILNIFFIGYGGTTTVENIVKRGVYIIIYSIWKEIDRPLSEDMSYAISL